MLVPKEWPAPIRELAIVHGVEGVRQAAITRLGFPIDLVETGSEIAAIRDYLTTNQTT